MSTNTTTAPPDQVDVRGPRFAAWVTTVVIVATLNTAIRDAIKTPEGKRFYDALGAEIGTMSAKEFGDFVAQELKRWEKIIALTGLPKQ